MVLTKKTKKTKTAKNKKKKLTKKQIEQTEIKLKKISRNKQNDLCKEYHIVSKKKNNTTEDHKLEILRRLAYQISEGYTYANTIQSNTWLSKHDSDGGHMERLFILIEPLREKKDTTIDSNTIKKAFENYDDNQSDLYNLFQNINIDAAYENYEKEKEKARKKAYANVKSPYDDDKDKDFNKKFSKTNRFYDEFFYEARNNLKKKKGVKDNIEWTESNFNVNNIDERLRNSFEYMQEFNFDYQAKCDAEKYFLMEQLYAKENPDVNYPELFDETYNDLIGRYKDDNTFIDELDRVVRLREKNFNVNNIDERLRNSFEYMKQFDFDYQAQCDAEKYFLTEQLYSKEKPGVSYQEQFDETYNELMDRYKDDNTFIDELIVQSDCVRNFILKLLTMDSSFSKKRQLPNCYFHTLPINIYLTMELFHNCYD